MVNMWENIKENFFASFRLVLKINECLMRTLKHFKDSVIRYCVIDLRFVNLLNEAEYRD